MTDSCSSIVLEKPRKLVKKQFPIPTIEQDEMLLKVELVGICGSDPLQYTGALHTESLPKILGHELVGYIAEAGKQAKKLYKVKEGDRITVEPYISCRACEYCEEGYYQLCQRSRCYGVTVSSDIPPHLWGGYSEYMYISPGSKIHQIKREVPARAAILSSVIGNGVRWIRRKARLRSGERVTIIGAGAQGLATTIAAKEAGASHIIMLGLARDQSRFQLAREFGCHQTINVETEKAKKLLKNLPRADVVVECSGSKSGLQQALEVIKPLGRLILVGLQGSRSKLNLNPIVFKELKVFGGLGQCGRDVRKAVRIINSGQYPVDKMVTAIYELDEAEVAIEEFMKNPEAHIRIALKPR